MVTVKSMYQDVRDYLKGDYYTKHDSVEQNVYTTKNFSNLNRTISKKDLHISLSKGELILNDKHLSVMKKNDKHRSGVDICVSIDKSISLLLISDTTRNLVLSAHKQAIKKAVEYIQTLIYTREAGGKTSIKTNDCIISEFVHLASRNLDPQLHSHLCLYNLTLKDNKLKAIDFSQIYANIRNISYVYNKAMYEELSKEPILKRFLKFNENCEVVLTAFEKEIIDAFSTRKKEMVDYVERALKKGTTLDIEVLKENSVVRTRKDKEKIDYKELYDDWQKRFKELMKWDIDTHINSFKYARTKEIEEFREASEVHIKLVRDVLKQEKKIFFSDKDVERILVANNLKPSERFLERFKEQVDSIQSNVYKGLKTFYFKEDKEIYVNLFSSIKDLKKNEVKEIKINKEHYKTLNAEQKRAVDYISKNFLTFVQGSAGVGKSYMIRSFDKKDVVSVAFTHLAAKNIPASENFTIHSLLGLDTQNQQSYSKKTCSLRDKIVVIDEASMIDVNMFKQLVEELKGAGAKRIIFMGDVKQIQAISGQSVWEDIVSFFKTVRIDEIVRQEKEYANVCKAFASQRFFRNTVVDDYLNKNSIHFDLRQEGDQERFKIFLEEAQKEVDVFLCNSNSVCDEINSFFAGIYSEKKKQIPIIINKNDYKLNIFNGQRGFLDPVTNFVTVDGRRFDKSEISYDYAFAITVAKSQGQTFKKACYIPTEADNYNTIYTAMTRSREKTVVVFNQSFDREMFMSKLMTSRNERAMKNEFISQKANDMQLYKQKSDIVEMLKNFNLSEERSRVKEIEKQLQEIKELREQKETKTKRSNLNLLDVSKDFGKGFGL